MVCSNLYMGPKILTGCYGIDNFSKFKAENKFGHRHTCSISRTKFISPTQKLGKLVFCNSLSTLALTWQEKQYGFKTDLS